MRNSKYFLNTVLTILVGIGLSSAILVRTFAPIVILPKMSIPAIVLISVIALVIERYVAPNAQRCYISVGVFSALTFGISSSKRRSYICQDTVSKPASKQKLWVIMPASVSMNSFPISSLSI